MAQTKNYTARMFTTDINILAAKIVDHYCQYDSIYGVPRGGIPLAVALSRELGIPLVEVIDERTLIVDDLVAAGRTRSRFMRNDFVCIHIKDFTPSSLLPTFWVCKENCWINYFWEANESNIQDHIVRLIEYIGEDPCRAGMKETPDRIVKSWEEIFAGYKQDVKEVFKTFDDEKEQFGGLVYMKGVEFYSMCEHHWLPFSGQAFIAYIPNGPVIGVSKLARLLDIFACRFQMQERIGEQVTNALMEYLKPLGAACLIEAKHLCMTCRGIKKQHSVMGYSSLKGLFLENSSAGVAVRNELMALWSKPGGCF